MEEYCKTKRIGGYLKKINTHLDEIHLFSGNQLKIIALVLMVVEHFFKIFTIYIIHYYEPVYPNIIEIQDFAVRHLYRITAIAFPLFAFLLTEGFIHTHNRKKYMKSMLLFALISELPFDIAFFSASSKSAGTFPFYLDYQNIFFTLLISLFCLAVLEKLPHCESGKSRKENLKNFLLQAGVIVGLGAITELLKCDYGFSGILLISLLYLFHNNRLAQCLVYPALMIILDGEQPNIYTLIYCCLVLFYCGKRNLKGKTATHPQLKYLVYAIYPCHLLIFAILKLWGEANLF